MNAAIVTRRASEADLPIAAGLFDEYRQFYGQPSDYPLAAAFLHERFANGDSVVFLGIDPQTGGGLGFAQLCPSFSSIAARPIWILNDLFVARSARRKGVGRALLDAARDHAIATGAAQLVLETAVTNREAQSLYVAYGFKRDDQFLIYELGL
ncbi:MAG: N-acetyltransferase [Anaerolineales bacterium]